MAFLWICKAVGQTGPCALDTHQMNKRNLLQKAGGPAPVQSVQLSGSDGSGFTELNNLWGTLHFSHPLIILYFNCMLCLYMLIKPQFQIKFSLSSC